MSKYGSAMLANSMVYGRFRYWANSMVMPKEISDAIHSDVQALIWSKDLLFDPDEVGHEEKLYRFMINESQYNPRREGGIGLVHWPSHLKALSIHPLLTYPDARDMQWKKVLDWWWDKFQEGRGAIFTTLRMSSLCSSRMAGRQSKLPKFFRYALKNLRELKLVPIRPGEFISSDEARAEPAWVSHRVHFTDKTMQLKWRYELEFNRLQDMINPITGKLFSDSMIRKYLHSALKVEDGQIKLYSHEDLDGRKVYRYIRLEDAVRQWRSFADDVGDRTLQVISGHVQPLHGVYSEAAQAMMEKMGWQRGEGIGKREDGVTDIVQAAGTTGRAGLGAGKMKMNQPAQKQKQKYYGHEPEPGRLVVGRELEVNGQVLLEVVRCTSGGKIVSTGERISMIHEDWRPALCWKGPVGIAETSYPHPKGWTFEGAHPGQTLDTFTVRTLTALIRQRQVKPPSCEASWQKALGLQISMREVWRRLLSPLLTPRDSKNYFRYLHRSMRTRNLVPRETDNEACPADEAHACRVCKVEMERFSHISSCYEIQRVFGFFIVLADKVGVKLRGSRLLYDMGMISSEKALQGSLSALHVILWKFIIIDFVNVDTEARAFVAEDVWKAAVRRTHGRLLAQSQRVRRKVVAAWSMDRLTPPLRADIVEASPLADYHGETGEVQWHPEWITLLDQLQIAHD